MEGLRGEIIAIGKMLIKLNSPCRYEDYYNVFKERNDGELWVKHNVDRLMRKMREQGVFFNTPAFEGRFVLINRGVVKDEG